MYNSKHSAKKCIHRVRIELKLTREITLAIMSIRSQLYMKPMLGTVAVDLPPTTKNLSMPPIISSSHRLLICTLSVDLAVTFT